MKIDFTHKGSEKVSIGGLKDVPFREEGKAAVAMPIESMNKITAICPDCTCTMIKKIRSCNYFCGKCNRSWPYKDIESLKE